MSGTKITFSLAQMAAAFVLLLAFAPVGLCQTDPVEEAEPDSSEVIDEIIVYGEQSISELRREVYKAEENFFDVFNSLNEDFEYDVNCYNEVPTGTHIRRHVCKANFVVEATSVQYVEIRTRGPRYPVIPPELVIAKKRKILRRKMEALIAAHPELLQALAEYTSTKATLKSERAARREN